MSESSWCHGYVAALKSIAERCPTAAPDIKFFLAHLAENYVRIGGD